MSFAQRYDASMIWFPFHCGKIKCRQQNHNLQNHKKLGMNPSSHNWNYSKETSKPSHDWTVDSSFGQVWNLTKNISYRVLPWQLPFASLLLGAWVDRCIFHYVLPCHRCLEKTWKYIRKPAFPFAAFEHYVSGVNKILRFAKRNRFVDEATQHSNVIVKWLHYTLKKIQLTRRRG